jgi:hypothetical protein
MKFTKCFWAIFALSSLNFSVGLFAKHHIEEHDLCSFRLSDLVKGKEPLLHPRQPGIGPLEVERKQKKMLETSASTHKWDDFLEDNPIPIFRQKIFDPQHPEVPADIIYYMKDHHHEARAIENLRKKDPRNKKFHFVYGVVEETLVASTTLEALKQQYLKGLVFPFRRGDGFMDREGRLMKFEAIPESWFHRIPNRVADLENARDRDFGARLRDALKLPHHLTFFEFKLAEAAKLRWNVTDAEIDVDLDAAVKKALPSAKKDQDFLKNLAKPGVVFQP